MLYAVSYYWPAQWASIVLLAGVCRLQSFVTLPAGGPAAAGRAPDTARRASTVTSC